MILIQGIASKPFSFAIHTLVCQNCQELGLCVTGSTVRLFWSAKHQLVHYVPKNVLPKVSL